MLLALLFLPQPLVADVRRKKLYYFCNLLFYLSRLIVTAIVCYVQLRFSDDAVLPL